MGVLNERIKAMRMIRGYTLAYVAELLGIKEATMQRYESGEIKNIKHETISKLAEIYNCTPAYLMGWEKQQPSLTKEDSFNYFLEMQLRLLGYEIIYEEEDCYTLIKYEGTEYEINDRDIDELSSSTRSYINFRLHEILKSSRVIGANKNNVIPIPQEDKQHLEVKAAHNDNATDPEQQRLMAEDIKDMEENW